MNNPGLVYVGRIIEMQGVKDADFIVSATVVCGSGGRWRGIVRKSDFKMDDMCVVLLPDSQVPERDDMAFLRSSGWRVRMRRFKGAPSEVVIIPYPYKETGPAVGADLTAEYGVTKYQKEIPASLACKAKGNFPSFIPKTDEPNYQNEVGQNHIKRLIGQPYYVTVKMDGSSTTAYKYKGEFGLCSRNWELQRDENSGYWQVAIKYKLEENLPEGYALQWETCGPKIQSNPMGLKEIDGFAFSAYKIDEHRYLEMMEFWSLLDGLKFPSCRLVGVGAKFSAEGLELLGEGKYANGKEREGVVVRSQENFGHAPLSFKVINLNYDN